MPSADVLTRPSRGPDQVLTYGSRTDHLADLRFARGPAAAIAMPLVLFIHGGFWRAAYDRQHTGPLTDALADHGFAVCTPEFRRTGQAGGGWPGTFDDIALAVSVLPALVTSVSDGRVDTSRLVLAGHSAGGHLALWAAAGLVGPEPSAEVISLAGVCDLTACYRQGLDGDAAGALIGGGPETFPDRYAAADPMSRVPLGARMTLVHGTSDRRVPWEYSRDFAAKAQAAGDQADLELLSGCGHFELIDPLSVAWPVVLAGFRSAADRLRETS